MGNSSSTIGDIFFPDNPNRRARAQELKDQITSFGAEFKYLKDSRDATLNRIRGKLDVLLHERGFTSSQDLENKVHAILSGEELAKYNKLKNMLDINEQAQGIVWDLVGIVGASSGVIIGIGFVAGIVTGGAALAALAAVGDVLVVVAVVIVVFGVIEGAIERSKLRDAINELWPKRVEIKKYVEQMRAIVHWVDAIEVWLNNPVTADPETLNTLLNNTLDKEYNAWTIDHVYNVLLQMDRQHGSWTNEDPGRESLPKQAVAAALKAVPNVVNTIAEHESAPNPASVDAFKAVSDLAAAEPFAKLRLSAEGKSEEVSFAYLKILSKTSCLAWDGATTWKITAVSFDPAKISLDSTTFDLEPMPSAIEGGHAKRMAANTTPGMVPSARRHHSLIILSTATR